MADRWSADQVVYELLENVKEKNHPHLAAAKIAVEFVDSKPFIKDRLNLGKVSKFSKAAKIWHPPNKRYDFCISICADVWMDLLQVAQREPYLDLKLCQCQVEYEPEVVEENGKKQVVKDEYGRVSYTDEVKVDADGEPMWKVVPVGIPVFVENVKRYGLWYEDFVELKQAIEQGADA